MAKPGRPRKLGPRPKALPEHTQCVIAMFLTHCRESAIRAIQSLETVNKQAPHLPFASGNLDYWQRIAQACDYMLHRLSHKQEWLVMVQQQDPFDFLTEGVQWSQIQMVCGVTFIKDDPSQTVATVEQSQSTCPPITPPLEETPSDTSRPKTRSRERGKGSAKKSLRQSVA